MSGEMRELPGVSYDMPQKGGGTKRRWLVEVAPSTIRKNMSYQRELRRRFVQEIIDEYDPDLLGTPVLNHRLGFYWIIDGDHRRVAHMELFGDDVPMQFHVLQLVSEEEEARKFFKLNELRARMGGNQKFKAEYKSGEGPAVVIAKSVERAGMKLDFDTLGGGKYGHETGQNTRSTWQAFRQPTTLRYMLKTLGEEGLIDVLTMCHEAWRDRTEAVNTILMRGVGLVYKEHGGAGAWSRDMARALRAEDLRPGILIDEAHLLAQKIPGRKSAGPEQFRDVIRQRVNAYRGQGTVLPEIP